MDFCASIPVLWDERSVFIVQINVNSSLGIRP